MSFRPFSPLIFIVLIRYAEPPSVYALRAEQAPPLPVFLLLRDYRRPSQALRASSPKWEPYFHYVLPLLRYERALKKDTLKGEPFANRPLLQKKRLAENTVKRF